MAKIITCKPKQAKPDELTIDTVVRLESGLRRISKHIYSGRNNKKELYVIPLMRAKGRQPLKTSYHGTGQMHGKLAIGKLKQATFKFGGGKTELLGIETLGEATPDSEILLWQEQGTPLNSIKGVVDLNRNSGVESYRSINIAEVAKNYPATQKSKADYIFEIDVEPTPWVDIKHFLMEPGSVDILEEHVKAIAENWSKIKSNPNWPQPPKFKYLEKAVIFTNLIPWFVIALFRLSDDAKGSESFLNGQP